MGERKSLLDLDASLFRSWFSALPLSSLVPFLQEFTDHLSRVPACVLDCLQGTCHRLQGLRGVSNSNSEVRRPREGLWLWGSAGEGRASKPGGALRLGGGAGPLRRHTGVSSA